MPNNKYVTDTITCLGTYNTPGEPHSWRAWNQLGHKDGIYFDIDSGSTYHVSFPVVQYIGNIKDLQ